MPRNVCSGKKTVKDCKKVKKQSCKKVEKQNCSKTPVKSCKKVPIKTCVDKPVKSCKTVHKQKCEVKTDKVSSTQRSMQKCFFNSVTSDVQIPTTYLFGFPGLLLDLWKGKIKGRYYCMQAQDCQGVPHCPGGRVHHKHRAGMLHQ